jgi:hypothetical protein
MPDSDFDREDWMLVTVILVVLYFILGLGLGYWLRSTGVWAQ